MKPQALVTGASEGIGRDFAIKLAKEGYVVTAVARNGARLQQLISEIGDGHRTLVADLSRPEGVQIVKEALARNHFQLLVNNAGIGVYGPFFESDLAEQKAMQYLNCDAVLELSHEFLKNSQRGDALINVASTAARMPMPISAVYTGSKAFVAAFSECLWYEQRSRGVYVMALCPGMTVTQFHTRAGGNNRDIPWWFSLTSKRVVAIAWRALQRRRKPVVITGQQNLAIFLARFLPRKWVICLAAKTVEWGMNRGRPHS